MIGRFLQGATFYPFPCHVPGAFKGWGVRDFRWYLSGLLSTCALAIVLFAGFVQFAHADPLPGPIPAEVVSVYDGDTITVKAAIWPGIFAVRDIRVLGVDTPEIQGKCEDEHQKAIRARDLARELVGNKVHLKDVEEGTWPRRDRARVILRDGSDLAVRLIQAGLGRPYEGGKREGWC